MPRSRRVLILAVDGSESLDVVGPMEVLHAASYVSPAAYELTVVAPPAERLAFSNLRLRQRNAASQRGRNA